jgi:DNA-binding NtrC family response regulator
MQALAHTLADVAPTDIAILLVGESGTGKEAVARQIHRLSRRRDEPFLKLTCPTLTPEYFNSEFYSNGNEYEENRSSCAGTVFLDEVSDLDLETQSKLLHALPDGSVVTHRRCLGARVISATTRNLEGEMRSGRFREELYYRLNCLCLHLPPLRDRKEDIPILIDFFLKKYAAAYGRPQPSLSSETWNALKSHHWPGNIREAENVARKVVALGDERAAVADLASSPAELPAASVAPRRLSLKEAARAASRQAERKLILQVLARTRWNRKRAAQELQISYKALLYKLKQLEVDPSIVS